MADSVISFTGTNSFKNTKSYLVKDCNDDDDHYKKAYTYDGHYWITHYGFLQRPVKCCGDVNMSAKWNLTLIIETALHSS
jgi:C1A family cysteine protease